MPDTERVVDELARLREENARLRRLLELTPEQARSPAPAQTGMFLDRPGPVTASSSGPDKVRFFRTLFAARTDVYATRWENARTGRSGWVPAVAGGWRKGQNGPYLRLSDAAVEAHLTGDVHIGLYPMRNGDVCHWLAADFDGATAMLDALSYLKAARAVGVPAALEVSRSGTGAHVWIFFTGPVAAATARGLGSGLLREAIVLARADGAQRLRPPVPVAGRPPDRGRRQPHRGAVAGSAPQGRRDSVPRPEHAGGNRGPRNRSARKTEPAVR
jgi:hypothetical protein